LVTRVAPSGSGIQKRRGGTQRIALEQRRQLLIARGWIQAVAIVMIFGFTVMGMLAYQTYTGEPPIPLRVTDIAGQVLFTRGDILVGRGVFLS
jgi:nitric oxide reductase subunit B